MTDHQCDQAARLAAVLERLEADPGTITLLGEAELELVAEMEAEAGHHPRYPAQWLGQLQEAASRHLAEKAEIRDTLALLRIYHRANQDQGQTSGKRGGGRRESARKKQKSSQDTVDS